jgi:hypothetical protein
VQEAVWCGWDLLVRTGLLMATPYGVRTAEPIGAPARRYLSDAGVIVRGSGGVVNRRPLEVSMVAVTCQLPGGTR